MRALRLLFLALLVSPVPRAAAQAGPAPPATPAVTDPTTLPPVLVSPSPDLTLGALAGEGPGVFEIIVAARRLGDGSIVVADGGASAVRVFSAEGAFRREMGGAGDGPGEFRGLSDAFVLADTIFAWDSRLRRVSVFGPDGGLERTVRIAPGDDGGLPRVVGVLSDGHFVVRSSQPVLAGVTPSGLKRDSMRVELRDPEGSPRVLVATLPGEESFVLRRGRHTTVTDLPLPHRGLVAARGDRVVVASSDRYRLRAFDSGPDALWAVEADVSPARLTEELVTDLREREVARLREVGFYERMRENVEAKYEALPRGRSLPVMTDLTLASDGRLWVRLADPTAGPAVWAVHGARGELERTIRLPEGVRLLDTGSDWMLGTFTDELGVPYVGLWRL